MPRAGSEENAPTWATLSSPLVDAYFEGVKEAQARVARAGGGLIPSVCRYISSWPDDLLLVELFLFRSPPAFRPMAVVFDPVTGAECGLRILPTGPVLVNMKLIGRDQIAGVDYKSESLHVFELPYGWQDVAKRGRIVTPNIPPRP